MEYAAKEKAFNDISTKFFNELSAESKKEMVYKRLSLNGIEFIEMYRDDGKAKPLMFLLHGGPGIKEQMLDGYSTKEYSANAYSQEGFYVIVPDCAAHGEDDRGPMLNMDAWLETVGYIDTLIEYAKTLRQADANRFGIFGISMGGTITFLYGAKGKHTPSVLLPEVGSPDIVGLLNGRANAIMNHSEWIGIDIGIDTPESRSNFLEKFGISESKFNLKIEATGDITKKAQELSPINYIEHFINIPMYARFGGKDDACGVGGVRAFINKLKEAGGTIQELIIHEEYGHGGFPDDYAARMNYVKKSMGII